MAEEISKVDYYEVQYLLDNHLLDKDYNKLSNLDKTVVNRCLAIENTLGSGKYFVEPKDHLIRFYNNWVMEMAIWRAYYDNPNIEIEFNSPESHRYILPGMGKYETDFHDKWNRQIEAKMFKTFNQFENWMNGLGYDANYGADIILVYVKSINTLFCVNGDKSEYYKAHSQIDILDKLY